MSSVKEQKRDDLAVAIAILADIQKRVDRRDDSDSLMISVQLDEVRSRIGRVIDDLEGAE